ncbi:DoxX family membrane protein [Flavobacteriaceae bacterium]|nr:DoxX family membrane protein [Flavobacteriaceae bacterium]
MKVLVGVSRIFVGVLFIISGLIKLNDPVGFSFKLGDYFAPEVLNLPFLEPYALVIAVLVVILEVLLGVMLIVGYAKKFTLWSLLLMIVFFTFLTFYSAYFNKVTDCGCFGDALKLTPWESFSKDVVLLVLILVLYKGSRYIQPFFSKRVRSITVFISLILCLWLGLHVLEHLPVIDFRAYKVGTNITKGMQTPANAPRAVYQYNWSFDVNGQQKTVINRGEDPKIDGTLLGVETSVLQKGYEPPIHDFSIERDGTDYTTQMLEEEHLLVVIAYNLNVAQNDGFIAIKEATDSALEKGYTVIGISASSTPETEKIAAKYDLDFKFYFCDMTALKTIIRSNPSIMSLEKGTILQKLHFNDVDQLKLKTLKNTSLTNDIPVSTLDSIN